MFKGINLKLGLLLGASTVPFAASAQTAPDAQPVGSLTTNTEPHNTAPGAATDLQEIVVTALRRDTTLQRTPAAVTALSGEDMSARGISTVEDLAAIVPDVSFGKNIGQAHIAIRGIGADSVVAGQDPRVAFYQDGVYIARPDAQVTGMFDVGTVQVLKGPQGTLYGRNATGGAVVVTSAAPTDNLEGYVHLGYGNYNAVKLETAASGPIAPTLSARFAVHYDHRDGYGKNIVTGTDIDDRSEVGARASLLWKPVDGLDFLTIADYSREDDRANGLHYFGAAQPGVVPLGLALGGTALLNSRDIASDIDPRVDITTWGIAEQASYNTGWAKLRSITAFRKVDSVNLTDVDGTSVQIAFDRLFDEANQFSQELTADGNVGQLSWLAGGQYFYEDIGPAGAQIPISSAVTGGPLSLRDAFFSLGYQKTYGLAGYGQLSYELVDGLKLTAGGRYSTEKKKLNDTFQLDFSRPYEPGDALVPVAGFPRHLEDRFSRFTPTSTLEYQVTRNVFAYFTYGQGFKSGGYTFGVNQPAYQPEKITSYEAGIKSTLADGAVTANFIGFHYDYTDLQVTQVRQNTSVTENAATAKVNGVEVELAVRPVRSLTLGGNFAYLNAKFDSFTSVDPSNVAAGMQDLSGNRLPQAPKVSFNLYAQNSWKLYDYELTARADYNYTGSQYFTPFENPLIAQKAYDVGSASLTLKSVSNWSIEGYVRNVGNTKAIAQTYVSSTLFRIPVLGTLIAPRTYGATLGYSF
ncbi:MAG: iron complex outerrane recepter protein [Gammaproteobacteria bacterium]|nr:iron complex outerrane recepter protein [Gammaproteobacteria bacterium]